jgi:hypothetical protein
MNFGRIVGVILGVLVVVGAAVFFFFRYSFTAEGLYRLQTAVGMDATPPERHIVPEGFRGWAVLRFGVEGAAPLPVDHETLIVEYPPSGLLESSTPGPDDAGFLHREYFRRTADGLVPLTRTGQIWGEYNMRVVTDELGAVTSRSSGFFVGTMTEFRQSERPRGIPEIPEFPEPPPD